MRRVAAATAFLSAIALHAVQAQAPTKAAISGRVVDDFGDPVIGASVTIESGASADALKVVATTDTDDRGEFRAGGLRPGEYAVAAQTVGMPENQPRGDRVVNMPGMHKTFAPGVPTAADAQRVSVGAGDDRAGVDIVVPADHSAAQPFSVVAGGGGGLLASPRSPSQLPTGTGVLRGRVLSTDGRLLPHAQVGLFYPTPPIPRSRIVNADGAGAFEFRDLPAGTFRLAASKAGYQPVPDATAQSGPPLPVLRSGRSVTLSDGEVRERADVALAALSTLNGHVLDDAGEPLAGARVQLLQVRYEAGRRQLVAADVKSRMTDDLGRYRLYGLPAGQFIVTATIGGVSSADVAGFLPTYFPGTPTPAEAQFVSIGTSQDVNGIDVQMVRGRTSRIAGKLLDAAGTPTTGGTVSLRPRASSSVVGVSVGARLLNDGQLEFPNVSPGDYVIQAYRGRSNASTEGEFGAVMVTVGSVDITDLTLQTSKGSTIAGVIRFESGDQRKLPAPSAVAVAAVPVDFDRSPTSFASADIHSDWRFEMSGINGPRRLLPRRLPTGWALKEILVNGIDATDQPLPFGRAEQSLTDVEIVLTDRVSELNGRVTDDRVRPIAGAGVVVFSTDRAFWYASSRFLRSAATDADGRFSIAALPWGNYHVAAVARLPQDGDEAWQDPQFLESIRAGASTVIISEGQRLAVTLRLPSR